VPLVEIVSEPDMRSAAEAGAYLRILKQLLEYTGVSDVSMEEGSLRVDANVSARLRGETKLGTKTEVKNMNSFSGLERAVDSEFARQCAMLDRGESVVQQTMLWDGARGEVRPSRTKEGSHDYRYFPEPDLPPLVLTAEWIARQAQAIPELPQARQARFASEYGLSDYDAEVLTAGRQLSDYFESVARQHGDPKAAANWVMGEVMAALNSAGIAPDHFRVRPADLAQLLNMVRDGLLSHSAAKRVFGMMAETGERPEQIATREGLLKVEDSDQLGAWIDQAITARPAEWKRLAGGETKLIGIFVGAVMKLSRGSADPQRVNQLLLERAATESGT
jgi:aspartyl-tRNA(Asn)/glutamyl-tRNA(Gln) amidotransferase subunit B